MTWISLFTNKLGLILYVYEPFYFLFCDSFIHFFPSKLFVFFPLIHNSLCVKWSNRFLIKYRQILFFLTLAMISLSSWARCLQQDFHQCHGYQLYRLLFPMLLAQPTVYYLQPSILFLQDSSLWQPEVKIKPFLEWVPTSILPLPRAARLSKNSSRDTGWQRFHTVNVHAPFLLSLQKLLEERTAPLSLTTTSSTCCTAWYINKLVRGYISHSNAYADGIEKCFFFFICLFSLLT